ncbi:MAG: hemolysin family protein [Bacteroidetes bacterium]|nr:hemolysin family protein [Bacteroidota bacterium]
MNEWSLIFITLIFSAFAAGSEIAFISSNKLRIELDRKQGRIPARIIWNFVKSPSRFIATMLIANNVAMVIYGIVFSESILTHDLLKSVLPHQLTSEAWMLIIQTFISTLIILVAAEFIPKAIFRLNPNGILDALAIPILIVYYLLSPVVFVVLGISKFVMNKIFRIEFMEEKPLFGRVDLDFYIRELTSKNSQVEEMNSEIRIFQNALDFTDVKVRECMVPRNEIVAIDVEEPVDKLIDRFIETKVSKILVYRDSIDNIIGFVHSSEMFKQPKEITSVLLPISIVPEVMPANELLALFTNQHKSIALVVDEFGGTSGMVTLEDVMEEIFGEIQDEHDIPDQVEKKLNENEFIFSGRLEIDHLNKKYNLDIPEHETYETLAGFIFHHHENIPSTDEEIVIPPFNITVLRVKDNRIVQVRLKVEREEEDGR